MKQITLFILKACPYCIAALHWQRDLQKKYPELAELDIKIVDERKEREYADSFDYYLVPTYYVDGKKAHEGAVTPQIVEKILRAAL